MTPGIARRISDEQNLENQIEKQMGCMAGFLQIFDRQQIIAGKRLYSPKRLSAGGSTSPSERSEASVASSFIKSPETSPEIRSESPARPVPLPVFEFKDGLRSSWKLREAPRLSLDSRAVVDAKGKLRPKDIRTTAVAPEADEDQRRSPSVVARLMGLDALPGGVPAKGAELRRSSSESRIPRDLSRDLSQCSTPAECFQFRSSNLSKTDFWSVDPKPDPPKRMISQRKAVFDDFYPEPKQTGMLYVEIEKRLRMRGIDEPAKDLETLKQILEAVQLKGLLHSKIPNLRADHHLNPPIVLMKPNPRPSLSSRTMPSENRIQNPRTRSPTSSPARSPISPVNRRALNSALNRKATPPAQKNAAAHSPRTSPRKAGPDPMAVRSPRSRTAVSSSVEDKATENWRGEYSNGRRLLERCDKLLHSIAAITAASDGEQQPSPVSVLDSASVLHDDATSPSGVSKRSIDFQDQSSELGEDWIPAMSGKDVEADKEEDFIYVSEILSASNKHLDPSDVYSMLEKRRQTSGAASKASRLHRKLVFDAVTEIIDFSPVGPTGGSALAYAHARKVWAELRRLSDEVLPAATDLNEVTRGAVRKDLASRDHGWSRPSAETSDAVLHIERQIFKDLVAETIRDLAGECRPWPSPPRPRRKLAF